MPDIVTLTCPSCGGKLQISQDISRFACGYCGNEHVVNRSGGIISLAPVVEELRGVKGGVDKTASELAIPRLEKEINELIEKRTEINGKSNLEKSAWEKKFNAAMGKSGWATTLFILFILVLVNVPAAVFNVDSSFIVKIIMVIAAFLLGFLWLKVSKRLVSKETREKDASVYKEKIAEINASMTDQIEQVNKKIEDKQKELQRHKEMVGN